MEKSTYDGIDTPIILQKSAYEGTDAPIMLHKSTYEGRGALATQCKSADDAFSPKEKRVDTINTFDIEK